MGDVFSQPMPLACNQVQRFGEVLLGQCLLPGLACQPGPGGVLRGEEMGGLNDSYLFRVCRKGLEAIL